MALIDSELEDVSDIKPEEFSTSMIKLLYYKIEISKIKKLDNIDLLISKFKDIETSLDSHMLFDYYYLATDLFRRGDLHVALHYFQKLEDLYLKTSEVSSKYEENTGKYNLLLGSLYDPLARNNLTSVDENRYSEDELLAYLKRADYKVRNNSILRIQVLTNLSLYYHIRMHVKQELELRMKILEHEKKLSKMIETSTFKHFGLKISRLADFAQELGDLDKFRLHSYEAIRSYENALNDNTYSLEEKMTINAAIGQIYYKIGNLNQAKGFASKALEVAKSLGNKQAYAAYLENLARYHLISGNYNNSIQLLHELLDLNEELQSQSLNRSAITMLGSIYERGRQLDQALEYYEEAYSKSKHSHSIIRKIVEVAHQAERDDISRKYLSILEERTKNSANPFLLRSYQLAKAFILKDSPKMKDKVEAENILVQILDSSQKSFFYTIQATKYLCEILLFEAEVSKDESIFSEIRKRVDDLHDVIEMDRSGLLIYDILILQSKLAFIEGNLDQTDEYLEKALDIAKESGHTHIISTLQQEKEAVEREIHRWDEIIKNNPNLIDRIERTNLKKYLDFAISITEFE